VVQCPHGPPGQPSVTKWVPKTGSGCAPPAAENNFILGVGGANVQQHIRQHLSGAMTLLNVRQTKVGSFEEALPSSCMSKMRITDGWLRGPLALGRILRKRKNLLVESTWEVVVACCSSLGW
jgi:hypothetical protein